MVMTRRMPPSGMGRRVVLVRTDILEEHITSIIGVCVSLSLQFQRQDKDTLTSLKLVNYFHLDDGGDTFF
jgi:hypothetical protein